MLYSNLIEQKYDFTYSANIQYDINSDSKLKNFIPNMANIELLKELFYNITNKYSKQDCFLIYGSYGTGKSHLLTVLSQLLHQDFKNSEVLETFLKNSTDIDEKFPDIVESFYSNDKPYLLVPISSNFDDFNRCIYKSLIKTLKSIGITIDFKEFYNQALNTIYNWEENEQSDDKLNDICKNNNITKSKLKSGLKSYNRKYKDIFKKIFKSMTFGVDFIYETSNLEDTIQDINNTIEGEFSGIVFIFDEFGKYLEDNLRNIQVKQIQDLAEFCDRSNNRLILVSHKQIALYTNKFIKKYAEEWKKIESRFKKISINSNYDQSLMITQSLISKNENWKSFEKKFQSNLNEIYQQGLNFKGYSLKDYTVQEKIYPLHTITLYALDKLSKKIAQNDRTFFTYLSSKQDRGLYSTLKTLSTDKFYFIGLDSIFDYFEPNFKEYQGEEIYNIYRNYQTAVSKCSNAIEIRVLKAITVICTINDSVVLSCNKENILNLIDCPKNDIEEALNSLCNDKVLKYSKYNNIFEFFNGSIIDIDALIQEKIVNINESVCVGVLNQDFRNFLIYPHKHNDLYKIKRAFIPTFVTYSDFVKKNFEKVTQNYDGVVFMVISNDEYSLEDLKEVSGNILSGIVIININCGNLIDELKKYIAIQLIETQIDILKQEDLSVVEEVNYYKVEQTNIINRYIQSWKSMETTDILVVSNGERKFISTDEELSNLASDLMNLKFNQSMIVNNELLNKNRLTPSMITAKKIAINSIINHFNEYNFGITTISPEYLIIRSVLLKNGFIKTDNIELNKVDGKLTSKYVMQVIDDFVSQCKENPTSAEVLYNSLVNQPIGCRLGYIDIIFTYVLQNNFEGLTIDTHGVEKNLSYETVEDIVKRPKDYNIHINFFTNEQLTYIESLESIFNSYLSKENNRLKSLYDAIMLHYKNINKYARTTQNISDITKIYRNIMNKSYNNYHKFFFNTLCKLSIDDIILSKNELETAINSITLKAKDEILSLFGYSKDLISMFMELYQTEWIDKKSKVFDYYTNQFLNVISRLSSNSNEIDLINRLSRIMVGFEVSYWNDTHLDSFIQKLTDVKNTLNNYIPKDNFNNETIVKISTGKTLKEIVLSNEELSNNKVALKNKISKYLNDFGLSITDEDKIQVLISIIDELIKR